MGGVDRLAQHQVAVRPEEGALGGVHPALRQPPSPASALRATLQVARPPAASAASSCDMGPTRCTQQPPVAGAPC
eukprot:COSAG05_NODE_2679_length_2775_cov_6.918161_1_plen_75_part_00